MNVFWHRPNQKSSAFMYITFRMSSRGGGSAVHGDGLVAAVNIKSATHDPCHLPTYQEDSEKQRHIHASARD